MTNNGVYSKEPRPRLCHLRRWPDFVGYGFNLHCEKAKPGQFIGKVDPDSPADSAGIRENDRIIEVNFVPIGAENHKQVVARIKEGVTRNGTKYPEEVILLVLDQEADDYYKRKSYVVRSTDANVLKLETEIRDGSENGNDSPHSSNRSLEKGDSHSAREPSPPTKSSISNRDYRHVADPISATVTNPKKSSSPTISRTSDPDSEPPDEHERYPRASPPASEKTKRQEFPSTNIYTNINASSKSPPPNLHAKPTTTSPYQLPSVNGAGAGAGGGGVFDLPMSAAEYREKLKAQNPRKRDPRQGQHMSMKEKHDFIDRL